MKNYIVYFLSFFICKNIFADPCTNANCTANDVSTAVINLISGPTICVDGTQIYLQLQAQTIAGANLRYDIGYFIATDGGDAKTGVCYRDYLPAPLNNTATVGLTRTSPFYNADTDTCGDIEQNVTNFRNIGGTTVSSGTPGPPALITVPCRDFNNDLVSDVGICTSWDNQSSNNCSSAAQAIPGNNSKCNCSRLAIGNIVYKATCQNNSDCNDNNACTTDTCNTNTDFKCTNTPIGAGTSCNDGNPCTTNDVCGGTNNTTCLGTAVVCSALDQCHDAGVCDFNTGLCTNPIKPNGTACDDGQSCTTPDTCNNGACTTVDTCPLGQMCQGNSCILLTSCTINSDCNDNNACTIDSCVSGFCTNSNTPNNTVCNDNNLCTNNDICTNGTCAGSAIVCSPLDQCHIAGVCDTNTGLCSNPNAPNNTVCNDSNLCTNNDVCTNGACTGSAIVCSPLDQCHIAGICDTNTGLCSNPNAPNNTVCNDSNLCTNNDVCTNGTCSGNAVICTALDQCHIAGVCDTNTGLCSNPNAPNNTVCNDNSLCTNNDICTNGTCTGSAIVCNPLDQCHIAGICDTNTGLCSNPNAPNNISCDDAITCTSFDVCNNGVCQGTDNCPMGQMCDNTSCVLSPNCIMNADCNDNNVCTIDSCVSGFCSYTNAIATSCNDGNLCTNNDICSNGTCVGSPIVCSTLDQCHIIGICDTNTGLCSNPNAPNNTVCNDSNLCTNNDICTNGTCTGSAIVCNPLDQCHIAGICDTNTGLCSNPNAPNNISCDDAITCTSFDVCNNGVCQGTDNCPMGQMCDNTSCVLSPNCSVDADCNDNNECSIDTCVAGFCANTNAIATACDDGNLCTNNDICSNGQCMGVAITCMALDQCHIAGMCDPNTGMCDNPNASNNTACNDGNLCTNNDTCTNGACIGSPIVCTALDQCHIAGTCNPSSGICSNPNAPNNTPCDDADDCTINDVCTNGTCQSGSMVTCNNPGICQVGPGLCLSGICNYERALDGTSCLESMICQTGICLSVDECMTKEDCPTRECLSAECIAGACNYFPLNINEGAPCGMDNICHNGMCVECLQDNNCPYLNACMQNSCTPNNECNSTEIMCPSGDQCNLSSCDLNQGCITTALNNIPCNDNFPCTNTDSCINGTCQGQPINCLPPDTCSVGSCNIFTGQCMFESYCIAPTFCDNSIPQGQCLQCDEMHACPNNLLCVNGSCIGCIDENDCSTGDDCVLTQCINQQCVYKYLDRCAQNNDDDNSSSTDDYYIANLPYIKPEIEVIDIPIIKENIIEEETRNNNKEEEEEKGFFSCSSTSGNLEVILYLIFMYFILIKKRNQSQN